MRFRRKATAPRRRGDVSHGAAPSTSRRKAHYDLDSNTGADGLPGRSGYPGGAGWRMMPQFFHKVRPDGYPEDDDDRNQDSTPAVPSRRPMPRGFFGP